MAIDAGDVADARDISVAGGPDTAAAPLIELGPDTAASPVPGPTPDTAASPAEEPVIAPVGPPAPAAPVAAESRPSITGRRGRYRVDEIVGRGGASAVHKGWDRVLHRPVALKLLSYEVQPQPDDRHREARVVAALDHPGLVPVYDVSRLDGRDAVVMQLVEGPSLAERLREGGPLPLAEALRLGADVADGLAHVHAHDVVHRDVKPANILLAAGGARLTDFGIARAPGATTLTGQGMILGTAAYLAPEQVRHGEASSAVDVFALGLVLLECVTGKPCYPSSPAECAARLDVRAELPDDLPEQVREVLAAMTDLDAAQRPAADAVRVRLAELVVTLEQEGEAVLDTPSREVARARPVPFPAAVVGLLLAVAVVVAVLALVQGRPDVAVPVAVAAAAAQAAVLWAGRRGGAGTPRDPRDPRPPAPAGP